jgi:hypothetical protein
MDTDSTARQHRQTKNTKAPKVVDKPQQPQNTKPQPVRQSPANHVSRELNEHDYRSFI